MDRVTTGLLTSWLSARESSAQDESEQFEDFVSFIILSRNSDQQFAVDDFSVGAGGTQGIDAFALSINGELIPGLPELEDALSQTHKES